MLLPVKTLSRFAAIILFTVFVQPAVHSQIGGSFTDSVRHFKTDSGLEFGLWGGNGEIAPAPVLFILASTIDETLGNDYFRQCGTRLAKEKGWLCVSLDLPYHGKLKKKNSRDGLMGWAAAAQRREDFVAENNSRMKAVLDFLVRHNYADENKIFVCGTSRGGYLALQFAAVENRVGSVAAFAPVTDLTALREFQGIPEEVLLPSFNLNNKISQLTSKKTWIVIGDRDERVSTDLLTQFARDLSKAIVNNNAAGSIELNLLPEPKGHTTPKGAVNRAVDWFKEQIIPSSQHIQWDSTVRPDIFNSRVELFRSLPHSKKDIVFLGNSITFWGEWAALLKSPHVKNRGIPGDITFGVLERLDEVVKGQPAKVFVLIGINDLAKNIPDSIIIWNYNRIIGRIKQESPRTKLYLQTLLPTHDILNKKSAIYKNDHRIQHINKAIKEIGLNDKRIVIIDLYPAFADPSGKLKRKYTWDGVHLNIAGYRKWAEILKQGKYLK